MRFVLWLSLLGVCFATGFGTDRRRPLPQASPYTCVVKIFAHGGVGCGCLIGPDVVLTVAHAVSDPKGELYPDVEVELAPPNSTMHARVRSAILKSGWNQSPDSGEDWALLKLDRPFGWRTGWVEPAAWSRAQLLHRNVEFVGWGTCPDERHEEFLDQPFLSPGRIRDVGEHIVFHDCAMFGGSSGGPLFAREDGKTFVVAVNTAGVSVEGEKLDHGFRARYTKALGNIAVPGAEWLPSLQGLAAKDEPQWREFQVRNHGGRPLKVRVRYPSLLADPLDPWGLTDWKTVYPGATVTLVAQRDGLQEGDEEVWVCAQLDDGKLVGPAPELRLESPVERLDFFRCSLTRGPLLLP